jgi:hypothetical protein
MAEIRSRPSSACADEIARDSCHSIGSAWRAELASDLRQPGENFLPLRIFGLEKPDHCIGNRPRNDIVLNELSRDLTTRDDVDEANVGNLHRASGERVRHPARSIRYYKRTVGDGSFQCGRSALAERSIRGAENAE